jgi:hypothetical protein
MRFQVSGPVSSMRWVPSPFAQVCRTPRGPSSGTPGLRVVDVLRLFLGVEVVQIAEELVEAVHRRQELVPVAEVVLAELAGRVALRFQRRGDGRVFGMQSERGARQADLRQSGAVRVLAGDERRPSRGAALFPVIVREHCALARDPVDVVGAIPHQAVAVAAEVALADVIAPDDEDVGFVRHLPDSSPPV